MCHPCQIGMMTSRSPLGDPRSRVAVNLSKDQESNVEKNITELITIIGVIAGLALAYGKAFGTYQSEITQAVIDVFEVKKRFRRILNLTTGVLIASAFTIVGAAWLHSWGVVPAGVLAGILASVEAGRTHDARKVGDGVKSKASGAVETP
jgi:hypothetical protein